jgi:hypothetical protein
VTDPLVEEAAKKAAIAWISAAGGPAYSVWCLALDGTLYVICGPGEQSAPGLATATTAEVTLRGDHGGAVVTFPATVSRVQPDSEAWQEVAGQLAGKRLNAAGASEQVVARWAAECVLIGLTPAGPPADRSDASGAAQVRPTPAANATRKPFRLHRVRRKAS